MSHDHSSHAHGASPYSDPITAALLNEALALLGDGVAASVIEAASTELGMPIGALATLDQLSLEIVDHALHDELHALEHGHDHGHAHDHGHGHHHGHGQSHSQGHKDACSHDHSHDHGHDHTCNHDHPHEHAHSHPQPAAVVPVQIHRHAHKVASQRMTESAVYVLEKMAHGYRRMGRAAGKGFYDYDSETVELWSGLKTFERKARQVSPQDARDRLLFSALLSALAQSDNQGTTPAHGVSVLGKQLPSSKQQAQQAVASMGQSTFAARCADLAARFGGRFAHPEKHHHHEHNHGHGH